MACRILDARIAAYPIKLNCSEYTTGPAEPVQCCNGQPLQRTHLTTYIAAKSKEDPVQPHRIFLVELVVS